MGLSWIQVRARPLDGLMGFDVDSESRCHCVYWPKKKMVSIERNVDFSAAERLEGK
jgi:hypothetical protein